MEVFKSLATDSVNVAMDATQTTMSIVTSGAFSSTGNFRLLIDSEIVLVTGVSGQTLTIVRGQDGTTGATHTVGAPIKQIFTAGALASFRSGNAEYDTVANIEAGVVATQRAGRLSVSSDGSHSFLDKGSSPHVHNGPLFEMSPPLLSSFAWRNQSTASGDNDNGFLFLWAPSSASLQMSILEQTPPTPPWSLTTYLIGNRQHRDTMMYGMALIEAGTGKVITLHSASSSGEKIEYAKWTISGSTTTFNSTPFSVVARYFSGPLNWFKVEHDGTNIKGWLSDNPYVYRNIFNIPKNTWFTTEPNRVGLMIQLGQPGTGYAQDLSCLHWKFN